MAVSIDDSLTVRAAAEVLGVTTAQVRVLGRRGDVTFLARGLLDATSVHALRAARQGRHTRAWSGSTAWAGVALLAGQDGRWLGQAQLSRLRSRLRDSDAQDLVAATRNRARVRRYSGHGSAATRLHTAESTVRSRVVRGLVAEDLTDWYVDERELLALTNAYGLRAAVDGRFVLRAVITSTEAITMQLVAAAMDHGVLAALDSAASLDARERGVAVGVLDAALDEFRSRAVGAWG